MILPHHFYPTNGVRPSDSLGNKTTMMTYRDESKGRDSGDVTTWLYDEASGVMTNKVYADGKGPKYDYTPDGKLSQRIWARGIATDYSYDGWGNLTNTVYSDDTPTVSLKYDVLGRQIEARDAAGVTTFLYDSFGSLTNETVVGVAGTNTIERFWDDFGRTAGYALNGIRQTTIGYEPDKGRISTMEALSVHSRTPTQNSNYFKWTYLDGSDLKSSLTYPNGLTASWQYDAAGQLLQVCNATPTNVISQYDYVYDCAGRRINVSMSGTAFDQADTIGYGYNVRSELTNAVASVDLDYRYDYCFDDIGNREISSECGTNSVYSANNLNQYAAVDDFTPQFDDDGNQTLVKTDTGIWSVVYNGENRPIYWSNGSTNIEMRFDRMGRRVEYIEAESGVTNAHHRFVYDGYVCIQRLNAASNNTIDLVFVWDSSKPIATRPIVLQKYGQYDLFYTHDGNKNVSELVFFQQLNGIAVHYEYEPFGALIASARNFSSTVYDFRTYNPFRFSSEYADDAIGLVYYNYRHYDPMIGRWLSRNPISESGGWNIYAFCSNNFALDSLGLGGIDDDLGGLVGNMWPTPPEGWRAEAERQKLERERKATESILPNFAVIIGVSGTRNFPVGGGWGISLTANISLEVGTCCDKEKKIRSYRKLMGTISAGPYWGFKPPFEFPNIFPPEVPLGYIGECPEPTGKYNGFLSFKFKAGGPYVDCSYSFKEGKWSCDAGFALEKISSVSVEIEGGVSYERVSVF